MINITKINYSKDNATADIVVEITTKAEVVITIDGGEWVSDDPATKWYRAQSSDGVWRTERDEDIPGVYVLDSDDLYEYVCEDLINVPEIYELEDGQYLVTADAKVVVLIEDITVEPEIDDYYAHTTPLSVSTDNIKIERV